MGQRLTHPIASCSEAHCQIQKPATSSFVSANGPSSWWRVWYYSAETYTSLGYGDELLEGPMRLLSGIECLNGLVLIGWTVSYLHMAMLRAWPDQLRGVE